MDAKDRFEDKIIVALSVGGHLEMKRLVRELVPYVGCFKVGLDLMMTYGALEIVKRIRVWGGKNIFFDGKFNDTPEVVAKCTKIVSMLGAKMFTIHASAGKEAVQEAVKNKGRSMVLGVTILTSLDSEECQSIFGDRPDRKVLQFAKMLKGEGADGIVCSGQETRMLRDHGVSLLIINPGTRPDWANRDDQKRVMTPKEAIQAGADYLVIGRPITHPPETVRKPGRAVRKIIREIRSANISE